MVAIQRHRGPDDEDIWFDPDAEIALGHNRLSIIDTTTSGRQPMSSHCGRYVLVFNGEIFNYKELRTTFASYPFRSRTDSEVILAAYEKWGVDCLQHFVGMYGFAIWDKLEKQLFCARDRFGIKPFYYTSHNDNLLFASEIKALLAAGVTPYPDWGIWGDYLKLGLYDHSERTFFRNIYSLKAGHYFIVRKGADPQPEPYWELDPHNSPLKLSDEEACEVFRAALQESVHIHLRSDVPLGVNLSGGSDSSALCMLTDAVAAPDQALSTFTMGFGSDEYDEIVHADTVPTTRPWIRNEVKFLTSETEAFFDKAVWHHEAPVGGIATLAYQKLHKAARDSGVKVLLEGQGMDEILTGYGYYQTLSETSPDSNETFTQTEKGVPRFYQDNSKFLAPELLMSNTPITLSGTTEFAQPFASNVENAMYADLMHRRVPRVLRMNDRLSMAYGVELREPFLDHRLVELAFRLPAHQKLRDGTGKYLLRACLADQRPGSKAIWEDKRKVTTPQREWLRGPLRDMVYDVISSRHFSELGIFDIKSVHAEFDTYVRRGGENSFYIWQWLNVNKWFKLCCQSDSFKADTKSIDQSISPRAYDAS